VAKILEPHGKLYGSLIRAAIGTLHVLIFTIVSVVIPLQWTVSSVNVTLSAYLIFITKPVTVEPPSNGNYQLIFTFSPSTTVTGASGVLGFVAAIIAKGVDAAPYPIAL